MPSKLNRLFLISIFLITPFMISCYAPLDDPFEMNRYLMDYDTFRNKSEMTLTKVTESDVNTIVNHATYKAFVAPINYKSQGSYIVVYNADEYQNIETLTDLANVKESYFNMSYLFPDNHTDSWGAGGKTSICIGVDQIILTEETAIKGIKISSENPNMWYLYYNNSWWKWNATARDINWHNLYPDPLLVEGIPVQ